MVLELALLLGVEASQEKQQRLARMIVKAKQATVSLIDNRTSHYLLYWTGDST